MIHNLGDAEQKLTDALEIIQTIMKSNTINKMSPNRKLSPKRQRSVSP